jgi:hypothetical protein
MAEIISRRSRREKEKPNNDPRKSIADLKTKKWSDLSSSEKDKIMSVLARERGFVKVES